MSLQATPLLVKLSGAAVHISWEVITLRRGTFSFRI